MKRVYQYRQSDFVVSGFLDTSDVHELRGNEFMDGGLGKDIFTRDHVGKLLYDPATGAVSNRPQVDIDAEIATLAKNRIRETQEFRSPDGTVWKLGIDNAGNITASKA